ncbi:MAG: FliH/SctL family protein, partial [Bdellovibrionota bacterium]
MANQSSSRSPIVADAKEYVFTSFDGVIANNETIDKVEFKEIGGSEKFHTPEHQKIIRLERQLSVDSKFSISPIVKQHRWMNDQEKAERDIHLEEQIEKRLGKIHEEAFSAGYQDGLKNGHKDAFAATTKEGLEHLTAFDEMITNVLATEADILKKQKLEIYTLIRTLAKWVILRELKDDGQYIIRLLEKLVAEIGQKDHLLIQVNKNDFQRMPAILEAVEAKIGKLTNVRYECDQDVSGPGVI